MDIKGSIAFVTGGASGMGRATAQYLKQAGAHVFAVDLNENITATIKEDSIEGQIADVTKEADVTAALDKAEELFGGAPRIIVNCAGICPGSRVVGREAPHDLGLFQKTLEINVGGSFNVLRLAAARMVPSAAVNDDDERGVIINTASVAAYEGQIGQAAYSASKGAVVGMTLPIARELAKFGIRIMTIAPGIMETPMVTNMPEELQESLKSTMLFPHRLGTSHEFAQLVGHICENKMLNGETIRLDGALRLAPK